MNCKILGSTSGELLEKKFHVNRSIEIFLDNRSNEFFHMEPLLLRIP